MFVIHNAGGEVLHVKLHRVHQQRDSKNAESANNSLYRLVYSFYLNLILSKTKAFRTGKH